jgi:hypothetical protein
MALPHAATSQMTETQKLMSVSRQILYAMVPVYVATAASCDVSAQPLESQQQVLNTITTAADRICNVIKIGSTAESVKGTDETKAEVRGLIKQLADLGINVQGQYSVESYTGVLQAELAKTLKNRADCRPQALDKLVDCLLHDSPEAAALLIIKCDRLASHPSDKTVPVSIPGVDFAHIESARAVAACRDALRVRSISVGTWSSEGRQCVRFSRGGAPLYTWH